MIAIAYTVIACRHAGIIALKYSISLLFPLAFIWFPEEIGNLTGYFRSGYVNVETPAIIISIIGWFFLVGFPVLIYLFLR